MPVAREEGESEGGRVCCDGLTRAHSSAWWRWRLLLVECKEGDIGFAMLAPWVVPRASIRLSQRRVRGQSRIMQDGVTESEVHAAADTDASLEQTGVPGRGVVPHPSKRIRRSVEGCDARGELPLGDNLRLPGIRREQHASGSETDHDVHGSSLPVRPDIRGRGYSSWSSEPSFFRTVFSPASIGTAKRFCLGGNGQLKL